MSFDKERIQWIDTAAIVAKTVNAHVAPVLSVSMVPTPSGAQCRLDFLVLLDGERVPIVIFAITGASAERVVADARKLKTDMLDSSAPVLIGQGGDA